ncbi:MAG: hypothetical protein IKS78_06735 [Clostridia bacterium]|nr:hypothetical protein [Clostridia bacterium]
MTSQNPLETLAATTANPENQSCRHICLDLETSAAPESAVQTTMRFWKAPATTKDPEKIEAARQKAEAKFREKSAVLDGAPIGCIVAASESGTAVFSCVKNTPKTLAALPAVKVIYAPDERGMLIHFRAWLDSHGGPDTVLIGHNIKHFDLPKLRNAYITHRLQLPALLQGANPVYDTMKEYLHGFTTEHEGDRFVKLAEIQAKFGLQEYKDKMDGAEAARLIALGQDTDKVLAYCWLDTMTTYQAFLHMTGQMPDEAPQPKADIPEQPQPKAEQPQAAASAEFDGTEDFIF